jgi:hypothetical protein
MPNLPKTDAAVLSVQAYLAMRAPNASDVITSSVRPSTGEFAALRISDFRTLLQALQFQNEPPRPAPRMQTLADTVSERPPASGRHAAPDLLRAVRNAYRPKES